MKSIAISVLAVLALSGLAGCSESKDEPTTRSSSETPTNKTPGEEAPEEEVPDEESPEPPTGGVSSERFQETAALVQDLLKKINNQPKSDPANTKQANKAAGLDETTPLIFADFASDPKDEESGQLCLEANELNTYMSLSAVADGAAVTFGDGDCSYEDKDAEVVGDLFTNEWTKGADLMGKLTPATALSS